MKKYNRSLMAMALISVIGLTACDGDDGKDGAPGEPGTPGTPGTPGLPAGSFTNTVNSPADFVLTLAPADIVVVGTEDFSLKFTVTGKNTKGEAVPFMGLDKVALYVTNQTVNITDTGAPMLWANNTLTNEFGSSMYCTPTGKATARGGAEVDACTLVEDAENPGTYTGSWVHDGNAPVVLADGDPNTLYRVMIRSYNVVDSQGEGISDKLLSTPLDFNPSTGELAVSTKDIVSNAACIKCHTKMEGYGEGDVRIANIGAHHNYQKVENCITCHNPAYAGGQDDPEKGFNANFNAMIHTIHKGHHFGDELVGEAKEEFGEIGFPSEINECTTCHDSASGWNDNVYAEACQGCHMEVDFTTGENHRGIVPGSDAACSGCHGAGSLSPIQAHKVGARATAMKAVEISLYSASYANDELVTTFNVIVDGIAADGFDFAEYAESSDIKLGTIDANGSFYVVGPAFATTLIKLDSAGPTVAGKLTVKTAATGLTDETIALTSAVKLCADKKGMVVKCSADEAEVEFVAATMASTQWNLANADGSGANVLRLNDSDRVTVAEAKCNACHTSLSVAKHGGYQSLSQCVSCHNDSGKDAYGGGSFHPEVQYKSDEVDTDGNPIFKPIAGLSYSNRDIVTVAHRFHSGLWDANRGAPAIYLDSNMETQGYPAVSTECTACHKDGVNLFAADGGLTSGKRALAVDGSGTKFISPVAEACRTCHAHSGASALAHFKSNGATVEGAPDTTADLPVESCATCHAEGKQYGIDKMHMGGAH